MTATDSRNRSKTATIRASWLRGVVASWRRLGPSLTLRVLMLCLLTLPLPGCGDKESAPELMTLEGKIEKLERTSDKTGKLTVVYYNEKQKQEMPGTGEVTAETEIMIDGAIATLADLHEGQRVRGEVRGDKKGGKRVQTVVKIQADRAKTGGGN